MLEVFDEDHLSGLIRESITQLCKNTFHYNLELAVEGLLGITLDKTSVMLINIKENVQVTSLQEDLHFTTSLPDNTSSPASHAIENKKGRRNRKAVKTYRSESTYVESEEDENQGTGQREQLQDEPERLNTLDIREMAEESGEVHIREDCNILEQETLGMETGLHFGEDDEVEGIEEQTCLVYDSDPILVNESPDENAIENCEPSKRRRRRTSKPRSDEPGDDLSSVTEMYKLYTMLTDAINDNTDEGNTNLLVKNSEAKPPLKNDCMESKADKNYDPDLCKNEEQKTNDGDKIVETETVDLGPLDLSCKPNNRRREKVVDAAVDENQVNTEIESENEEKKTEGFDRVWSSAKMKCNKPLGKDSNLVLDQAKEVIVQDTTKDEDCNNNETIASPSPKKSVLNSDPGLSTKINTKHPAEEFATTSTDDNPLPGNLAAQESEQMTDGFEIYGMLSETSRRERFDHSFQTAPESSRNRLYRMDTGSDMISNMSNNNKRFVNGANENGVIQPLLFHQDCFYSPENQGNALTMGMGDNARFLDDCKRMFEASLSYGINSQTGFDSLQEHGSLEETGLTNAGTEPDDSNTDYRGESLIKNEQSHEISDSVEGTTDNSDPPEEEGFAVAWHKPICYELLEPHGERKPKKGTFHYVVQETIRAACMEFLGQSAADRVLDLDRRHRNNIVEAVCERLMTRFPELRTESRISRILNCKIRKCISNKLYYYRRNPQERFDNLESG